MKTFALAGGDLVVSSGSYLTLSGADKVRQDLGLAMREHYGADPFHPTWGSVIDQFVGEPLTSLNEQKVVAEVSRVLRNYITSQASQINAAANGGGRSALNTADVVSSVTSIKASSDGDRLAVAARLTTMAGEQITINRTVIA